MDPLTAIGLAGTVVQFVDFGSRVLLEGRELYKSGSVKLNVQAEAVTRDLLDFSVKLEQSSRLHNAARPPTENELALRKLCDDCNGVAKQLLAQLAKLKPKLVPPRDLPRHASNENKGIWLKNLREDQLGVDKMGNSLRLALMSVWSRKELEELEGRLEKYRNAIQTRLIASLGDQVALLSIKQSQKFDDLDRETKMVVGALLDDMRASISEDIREQTEALAQLINRRERVIRDESGTNDPIVVDIYSSNREKESLIFKEMHQQEEELRNITGECILKSLRFEAQTERYEGVGDAHTRTFEWIFSKNNSQEVHWDSFVDWLERKDGLYWINGKAGCGKSTLMKYINHNPSTAKHLSTWAGTSDLYTAEFYFWNIGTALQKSQVGLLRSLLREVLERKKHLIPIVFPQQWAKIYSLGSLSPWESTPPSVSWSLSSLLKAWNRLLNFVSQDDNHLKLAIFIDGLDEFEGLDADIARLFKTAAGLSNVKACVSSRPHNVFEKAFAGRASLRLQDLTKRDIRMYVEDRLVKDEGMQDLFAREPVKTPKLVEEIVNSADGVFLWVYLVVTSLLRGLSNCDEISDLQRKLRLLPKDLKQLYIHMIVKIDEDYKEEAIQFFELINATQHQNIDLFEPKPMTVLSLCFAKEREENLPTMVKSFISSPTAMVPRWIDLSRRLKSRTGGLLEVQLRGAKLDGISAEMKVQYLHRTVRDFLITREMRDVLQAEIDFDAEYAMLKSSVYELQIPLKLADFNRLHLSALTYAQRSQAERQDPQALSQTSLLDQLFALTPERSFQQGDLQSQEGIIHGSFLSTAVRWGLIFYIQDKLGKNARFTTASDKRKLLGHALKTDLAVTPRIVLTLLTIGTDPFVSDLSWQQLSGPKTKPGIPLLAERFAFFQEVIEYLESWSSRPKASRAEVGPILRAWADVLKHLLNSKVQESKDQNGLIKASKVIATTFATFLDLSEELQQLLAEQFLQSLEVENLQSVEAENCSGKRCCFQ